MGHRLLHAWLVAVLLGCASSTPPVGPNAAERPARSAPVQASAPELPVLRVGTSGDYAPFSKGGAGFDVELAGRIAGDLGYRVEWVSFAWPELSARVEQGAFDVGMSGITWRPDRSLLGYMTRAVVSGGPCVLGDPAPARVAVNRGGVLERWARAKFASAQLTTVEDNTSLPSLLERGVVDAIVTDSFELPHFARPGWSATCDPLRDRKVYWLSGPRAAELGSRIDAWLGAHEADVKVLRGKWLDSASDWTDLHHLVDLLARRLALMPAVAAYKRAHGLPIDDPAREAVVLRRAIDAAEARGLERSSVHALFSAQIELAKSVQRRASWQDGAPPDLDAVLRPALDALGERILAALASAADALPNLEPAQLDLLVPLLEPAERMRLLAALRAVHRASPAPVSGDERDAQPHRVSTMKAEPATR